MLTSAFSSAAATAEDVTPAADMGTIADADSQGNVMRKRSVTWAGMGLGSGRLASTQVYTARLKPF